MRLRPEDRTATYRKTSDAKMTAVATELEIGPTRSARAVGTNTTEATSERCAVAFCCARTVTASLRSRDRPKDGAEISMRVAASCRDCGERQSRPRHGGCELPSTHVCQLSCSRCRNLAQAIIARLLTQARHGSGFLCLRLCSHRGRPRALQGKDHEHRERAQ